METQRPNAMKALHWILAIPIVLLCLGAATTHMVDQVIGSAEGLPHIGTADRYAGTIRCYRVQLETYTDGGELIIPVTEIAVTPVRSTNGSLDYDAYNDKIWIYGPSGSKYLDLN